MLDTGCWISLSSIEYPVSSISSPRERTSFNKIGCRECNLPASNRKAGITARSTSSLTVTNRGLRSAFNLAIAVSSRIDFHNAGVLIDNLRFIIAQLLDLMGDLVEVCLFDDHSNQFCATEFNSLAGITDSCDSQRVARATLVRIRIEGELRVES